MTNLILITLALLWSTLPIEKVDRPTPPPFKGDYVGASTFTPADSANYGYAETVDIWLRFNDSTYIYGLGDAFPTPEPTPQYAYGGGPFSHTDSTITFEGPYPKILRPAVILNGVFEWTLTADTLTLAADRESPIAGQHTVRLILHSTE